MNRSRAKIVRAAMPWLLAVLAAACAGDSTIEATALLIHDQCRGLQAGLTRIDWEQVAALRNSQILGMTGDGGDQERDRDLLMVAVSRGEQPTAGFGLQLEGVRREPGTAVIAVQWIAPDPDAVVAQVLTHPCLVIGLSESDVEGLERVEARDQHGTVIGGITR